MKRSFSVWGPYVATLMFFPGALLTIYSSGLSSTQLKKEIAASQNPTDELPYAGLIQKYSARTGMDWRLVASIIHTESRFQHDAVSPAGAKGLMQLMPVALRETGGSQEFVPADNIRAGIRHYQSKLARIRGKTPDDTLRLSLAAYNAGMGHLRDAQNLAVRLGGSARKWSDIREALLALEDPAYHTQAKYGYCRGSETVEYVEKVLRQYTVYSKTYPETQPLEVAATLNRGPDA